MLRLMRKILAGRIARDGAAVAIGSAAANALGLVAVTLASRTLTPTLFGEVATLFALSAVLAIPAVAIQFAVARRTSEATASGASEMPAEISLFAIAGANAGLGVLLSFWLSKLLDLPVGVLVLVSLSLLPFGVASGYLGLALGTRKMYQYATSLVVMALAKVLAVVVTIAFVPSAYGFVTATLVTTVGGALVLRWVCLRRTSTSVARWVPWREVVGLAVALGGFMVLTSMDLLIAKANLTPVLVGEYAAGNILTRIGLWAPQFIAVLVFPIAASSATARVTARALSLTAGIGLLGTLVVAATGTLSLTVVAGSNYSMGGWLAAGFFALGAILAIAHLMQSIGVARRRRSATVAPWIASAGLAVAGWLVQPDQLFGVLALTFVAASVAAPLMLIPGRMRNRNGSGLVSQSVDA